MKRLNMKLDTEGGFAVRRMFSSRTDRGGLRGSSDDYLMIAGAIERGYIIAHEVDFSPCIAEDALEPEAVHPLYDLWVKAYASGGSEHRRLKFEAGGLLHAAGESRIRYEYRCSIGIADVFGADTNTIVECGNTDPGKVFSALAEKDFSAFWLVPFPRWRSDGNRVSGNIYWQFAMSDAGFEWWTEYQQIKLEAAVEAMNRRPRR